MEQRETERQEIIRQYPDFYRIATALLLIGFLALLGSVLFSDKIGYGMNLWTDVLVMVFTYLILDWYIKQREERRSREIRIEDLIDDLSSGVNDVSVYAAKKLRKYKSLFDGSLENLDLRRAKLAGADLRSAKLAHANLADAILIDAELTMADLQ